MYHMKSGTTYTVPIGTNTKTDTGATELSEVHVMAAVDGTIVRLVDRDGNRIGAEQTLNQGQTYVFSDVKQGYRVVSDLPVQAHLVTGDCNSSYEMRWYSMTPDRELGDVYYTPVSSDPKNDPFGDNDRCTSLPNSQPDDICRSGECWNRHSRSCSSDSYCRRSRYGYGNDAKCFSSTCFSKRRRSCNECYARKTTGERCTGNILYHLFHPRHPSNLV